MELTQQKKTEIINIEEFKVLVNNLVPKTLKQAEWICNEVEKQTTKHPELKAKFKEFYEIPKEEREELENIILDILSKADKAQTKNSESH